MSETERRFTPDHVWIDAAGKVGVTERLIWALPRIAAVHLPSIGSTLRAAEPFGALEGDKGVLDLYAPCDGLVIAVNEPLRAEPGLLSVEPRAHWLIQIRGEPGRLLTESEYDARVLSLPFPHR